MPFNNEKIKEIREYRRKRNRGEIQKKEPKTDDEKLVDNTLRNIMPSYYKLKELIDEAADSAWFAAAELENHYHHVKNVHNNDVEKCSVECFPDVTPDEFIDTQLLY